MSALGHPLPTHSASRLTFVRFGPKADKRERGWVPKIEFLNMEVAYRAPGFSSAQVIIPAGDLADIRP